MIGFPSWGLCASAGIAFALRAALLKNGSPCGDKNDGVLPVHARRALALGCDSRNRRESTYQLTR